MHPIRRPRAPACVMDFMSSPSPHRPLALAAWVLVTLAVLLGAAAGTLDSQWFARLLIERLAAASGRAIRIEGPLSSHLLSLEPRLRAERVRIANPYWMPAGEMARIGAVTLVLRLPRQGRPLEIGSLSIDAAALRLLRDSAGNTNWQFSAPGVAAKPLPMVRRLSLPDAQVQLRDERLRLRFSGRVSGPDAKASGASPLLLVGDGVLNGRPVSFRIEGDPLAQVGRDGPWRFGFVERSSGAQLSGNALLPHAYDFGTLDAQFEASGRDLRDLYFLTGVTLPDTGAYRLRGRVRRRPGYLLFSDLEATSAASDVHATVLIGDGGRRSRVDADLQSHRLRTKDLGASAAGRAPPSPAVFPDSSLGLESLRGAQAEVRFRADRLDLSGLTLEAFQGRFKLSRAHLSAAPVSARYADGVLAAQLEADLSGRVPAVTLDLAAHGLRLAELSHDAHTAPVDGPLQVRALLQARGDSAHALAASAGGRVSVLLADGRIRASLAHFLGFNLAHALGLALRHSARESPLPCALARLDGRSGVLQVQQLLIDTPPARITGSGAVDLDSESLDLTLEDRPNRVHLPWRIPVRVSGPLLHPALSSGRHGGLAKATVAAGIATVLAPLEHALGPAHPGSPDECEAAIAQAQHDGVATSLR